MPLLYRSFAEEDSDKIGFIADGSTPLCVYENGEIKNRIYPRGTIVIERCLRREHESGRRRFTISHECAHYIMDRAVPSAASTESLITNASTLKRLQKPVQLSGDTG